MPSEMPNEENRFTVIFRKHRRLIIFSSLAVALLIILAVILSGLIRYHLPGKEGTQSDVLTEDALSAMAGYGLMPVQPDGSVLQDRVISRAEFAGLLSAALNIDVSVTNKPSYADVLPGHPQYTAIESVREFFGYNYNGSSHTSGISNALQTRNMEQNTSLGPDPALPKFNPDAPITRRETIAVLSAALSLDPAGKMLPGTLNLPADDPILKSANRDLLSRDAARLIYLLIMYRLPAPAQTFTIEGIR